VFVEILGEFEGAQRIIRRHGFLDVIEHQSQSIDSEEHVAILLRLRHAETLHRPGSLVKMFLTTPTAKLLRLTHARPVVHGTLNLVPATFVVVPQWQGSGSARAMRLVDGADAIRGDLPSTSTVTVAVPLEAGESQGTGVARFSSIQLVRDRLAMTLSTIDGTVITIGGDCGVELAAVERVADQGDLALIWFDAHGDLNTPESSPSSVFNGMVLRTLIGEGEPGLVPARPLKPKNIVLVGSRELDPPEELYVREAKIPLLEASEVSEKTLLAAVKATGASRVYIHVDLDVLDPAEFEGLDNPVPFGLTAANLVDLIRAVREKYELVGAGITEFAPTSPDNAAQDLPTILRVIGALAS
jgi:arginase